MEVRAGDPFFVAATVIFFVLCTTTGTRSETDVENDGMFTSSTDLERLLSTEAELVRALKDYVEQEEDRIAKLRRYIASYEDIKVRAETDVEKYIGNPLNSYLLIKKLTSDLKLVKDLMMPLPAEDLMTNLTDRYHEPLRWPSDEDLNGAAVGLTRLQDTYNLQAADLAEGKLNGVDYGPSLTGHDCFELGRQSYNNGDYTHTIQWMREALRKIDEDGDKSVDRGDVLEYFAFSWYSQGNVKKALQYTNELLAVQPNHPRAVGNKMYYEDYLKKATESEQKKGDAGDDSVPLDQDVSEAEEPIPEEEHAKYQKLCRGEKLISMKRESELRCRYYEGHHPYLKIAPYKEEEVHLDPRIVIYYDVLSDSEIETVKTLSTPR